MHRRPCCGVLMCQVCWDSWAKNRKKLWAKIEKLRAHRQHKAVKADFKPKKKEGEEDELKKMEKELNETHMRCPNCDQ